MQEVIRPDRRRIPIREWIERYNSGEFEDKDVHTQVEAGWFDWFCMDCTLVKKTRFMGTIVNKVKDGGKVDLDKHYVFFKNVCPMFDKLYDSFKICEIDTYKVLFVVTIGCKYEGDNMRYHVYSYHNEFEKPILAAKIKTDVIKWLNAPWTKKELKEITKNSVHS